MPNEVIMNIKRKKIEIAYFYVFYQNAAEGGAQK